LRQRQEIQKLLHEQTTRLGRSNEQATSLVSATARHFWEGEAALHKNNNQARVIPGRVPESSRHGCQIAWIPAAAGMTDSLIAVLNLWLFEFLCKDGRGSHRAITLHHLKARRPRIQTFASSSVST
jgi:hypothetical protein